MTAERAVKIRKTTKKVSRKLEHSQVTLKMQMKQKISQSKMKRKRSNVKKKTRNYKSWSRMVKRYRRKNSTTSLSEWSSIWALQTQATTFRT